MCSQRCKLKKNFFHKTLWIQRERCAWSEEILVTILDEDDGYVIWHFVYNSHKVLWLHSLSCYLSVSCGCGDSFLCLTCSGFSWLWWRCLRSILVSEIFLVVEISFSGVLWISLSWRIIRGTSSQKLLSLFCLKCLFLRREEESTECHGHITSLAVLRTHRKLGLATKLMNAARMYAFLCFP